MLGTFFESKYLIVIFFGFILLVPSAVFQPSLGHPSSIDCNTVKVNAKFSRITLDLTSEGKSEFNELIGNESDKVLVFYKMAELDHEFSGGLVEDTMEIRNWEVWFTNTIPYVPSAETIERLGSVAKKIDF